MKKNTGFTLIELLVVIAIIGILSSVVLASLNTARNKGADAAIKSDINNARAQAELFYDSNGQKYGDTATGVCTTTAVAPDGTKGIGIMLAGALNAGGAPSCASTDIAWAVWSPLKADLAHWYCVDSTGKSILNTVIPAVGDTACLSV